MMLSVEKSYTSVEIIDAKVLGVFYLMLHAQYHSLVFSHPKLS